MTTACPACGEAVSESGRFCPACGTRLGAVPDFTTSPGGLAGLPPGAVKLGSSSVLVEGGFAPGTVLGSRFRIIGLLGVGGMGEVYRADDLRLGQAVALKFLPKAIVDNAAVLEQFYAEVRTARQIAHPNVCRVYDADEVDGRHFLSMEYIDGEDLASLLKRIGHLPAEKVLEIAQQMCAGLAAAHRKGVVHRDLKPANIMVDGRGYARITDFGLAVSVGYRPDAVLLAGTPLYMAPEQLSGASATIRSDIYALGLVLYELTTGRSPFAARNFEDLKIEKLALVPRRPSELARDVDPAVERVILKCIERDPIARPSSVLEVAAALPGGSPVSAAIAAGATPSPEMVAAASAEGDGLTVGAAWALAAGLALSVALSVWLGDRAVMPRRVPLERPPAVFVDRARQIAEIAGYRQAPADTAFGVSYNEAFLRYLERDRSPARWDALSADAVRFWYRQSEQPLRRLAFSIGVSPSVTPSDPPLASGDVLVVLNGAGRLLRLSAMSSRSAPASGSPPDWTALVSQAVADPAAWTPTDPAWQPLLWADEQRAWRPIAPAPDGAPRAIEAASARGRPVEFRVVQPWDAPEYAGPADELRAADGQPDPLDAGARTAVLLGIVLTGVAMFGSLVLARRNLRLGRGDRRGAFRLAVAVAVALGVAWLLDEHHVADAHEWYLVLTFAGRALVIGGTFWWTYVAFEPYVRRHWPSTVVSWSRLVAGNVRDPLVGQDVVVGCVAGAVVTCLVLAGHLAAAWMGFPAERPSTPTWHAWLGIGHAISLALQLVVNALLQAFTALFILVLLRLWLKREDIAAVATAALLATPDVLLSEHIPTAGLCYFAAFLIGVVVLMRVGLLAAIALRFTVDLLQAYPIVADTSPWYFGLGFGALLAFGLLAAASFRVAVGGRGGDLARAET